MSFKNRTKSPTGRCTRTQSNGLSSSSNLESNATAKQANAASLCCSTSPPDYYNSSAPFLPGNVHPTQDGVASRQQQINLGGKRESPGSDHESHQEITSVNTKRSSNPLYYDHLIKTTSQHLSSPDYSNEDQAGLPQSANYDPLPPANVQYQCAHQSSLAGLATDSHSPLTTSEPSTPYHKKVAALGSRVQHSYEYVDIEYDGSNKTPLPLPTSIHHHHIQTHAVSPEGKEHLSDWLSDRMKACQLGHLNEIDSRNTSKQSSEDTHLSICNDSPESMSPCGTHQCPVPDSKEQSDLPDECSSAAAKRPSSTVSDAESGHSSRSSSPSHRFTHEYVTLKPKIQSIKVETATDTKSQSCNMSTMTMPALGIPPRPPRPVNDKDGSPDSASEPPRPSGQPVASSNLMQSTATKGSPLRSQSEALKPPPIPPRPEECEESELMLHLPEADIGFAKPAVPPKPTILNPPSSNGVVKHSSKYITVEFPSSGSSERVPHIPVQSTSPTLEASAPSCPQSSEADVGNHTIIYQSIDFKMSEVLEEITEEVKYERTKQLEYIRESTKRGEMS